MSFEGLRRREGDDGTSTVFVRLLGGDTDRFLETAHRGTGISSVTTLHERGDGALFQITFAAPFVGTVFAKYGLRLQRIEGTDEGRARVRVVAPPTLPTHQVVEVVSAEYPGGRLLETERKDAPHWPTDRLTEDLHAHLTERQADALELAVHGGYFESPKQLNGEELADRMGISSSAFYDHLRTGQRKILEVVFGDPVPK
jgi:DNA-binding CsgD family transcriptional regulator